MQLIGVVYQAMIISRMVNEKMVGKKASPPYVGWARFFCPPKP